ncbi:alpha/beta fold hydrolase [Crenothrix polyspora]|uniref:AB hydrolase-1 domain-containing protein n=1 Tax=Crenothrix polyspora TaxID=360316 RepID=A0A1R4H2U2_9GAMM|nr:alpha/beta fold hydrolase [Crenothrix polyspora]SJM90169.1 hypothetical protein CRENPOLYSF1_1360016 [Crenothrix polyspora]
MYQINFGELKSKKNNLWYRRKGHDTVVVFVHGIFSDSQSCWTHKLKNSTKRKFWPDLIGEDKRPPFKTLDIFLGGYFTNKFTSGSYDISNCASELVSALERNDTYENPTVLSYPNIVFVCHSCGGIITRYMLVNEREKFAGKRIGLILMASPSDGSKLADKLAAFAGFYGQKLGRQLIWQNDSLSDLDDRFKNLVHNKSRNFELDGIEAYENHSILPKSLRLLFPINKKVVNKMSACKYFPYPRLLPDTDHFSIVKPDHLEHPAHKLLLDFLSEFNNSEALPPHIKESSPKPDNKHPFLILEEKTNFSKKLKNELFNNYICTNKNYHDVTRTDLGRLYRTYLDVFIKSNERYLLTIHIEEGKDCLFEPFENKFLDDLKNKDKHMICFESGYNLRNKSSQVMTIESNHEQAIINLLDNMLDKLLDIKLDKVYFVTLLGPQKHSIIEKRRNKQLEFLNYILLAKNNHATPEKTFDYNPEFKVKIEKFLIKFKNIRISSTPCGWRMKEIIDNKELINIGIVEILNEYFEQSNILEQGNIKDDKCICFICVNDDMVIDVKDYINREFPRINLKKSNIYFYGFDGTDEMIKALESEIKGATVQVDFSKIAEETDNVLKNPHLYFDGSDRIKIIDTKIFTGYNPPS